MNVIALKLVQTALALKGVYSYYSRKLMPNKPWRWRLKNYKKFFYKKFYKKFFLFLMQRNKGVVDIKLRSTTLGLYLVIIFIIEQYFY